MYRPTCLPRVGIKLLRCIIELLRCIIRLLLSTVRALSHSVCGVQGGTGPGHVGSLAGDYTYSGIPNLLQRDEGKRAARICHQAYICINVLCIQYKSTRAMVSSLNSLLSAFYIPITEYSGTTLVGHIAGL